MNCAQKNGGGKTGAGAKTVAPRVDIFETENEFLLVADLPGVKPDEVDLSFDKGELTLHGNRTSRPNGKADFQRTFAVADSVAADKIAAELKHGVLTVRLPKVEAVKPKRVTVSG